MHADQTDPSVSVVVCAYSDDRRAALLASITSLAAQTSVPAEVIVVVDHNPSLLEWVRVHAPQVTAIASDQANGLAGARNTGVRAATGEVVAFLDDDARAAPDWLHRLGRAYQDPRVLGVGGAVVPEFERGRPSWLPEEFDWVVGCTYRGLPTEPAGVRNLIGCNMSFRREALQRTGGFVDGMGRMGADRGGCEETELCIRIRRELPDSVLIYDPGATVHHHVPATRARLGYFVSRCHAEGVSKAEVARRCGPGEGLDSERAYTRRTLPAGVAAGLAASLRGDLAGATRAGTILLGLVVTAAGFLIGQRPSPTRSSLRRRGEGR